MSDVWGGSGFGGGGWDADDPDLVPDPDVGDGDRGIEADLRAIEQAARAAFRGGASDGVLSTAPTAVTPSGSVPYVRTRRGLTSAGRGRKSNASKLADGLPTPDGRGAETGSGGASADHSGLSESVGDSAGLGSGVGGAVRGGSGPTPRPQPSRAKPLDDLTAVDRVGNLNTADGYKIPQFTSATIRASIKDLKFTSNGDMEVRLIIPFEYRVEGTKFADAYGLEIDITASRVNYGG